MEDKFAFVKAALKDYKGHWTEIASKAKVGRRTISHIINGEHSPTMTTIDKLYRHLKKLEKK